MYNCRTKLSYHKYTFLQLLREDCYFPLMLSALTDICLLVASKLNWHIKRSSQDEYVVVCDVTLLFVKCFTRKFCIETSDCLSGKLIHTFIQKINSNIAISCPNLEIILSLHINNILSAIC